MTSFYCGMEKREKWEKRRKKSSRSHLLHCRSHAPHYQKIRTRCFWHYCRRLHLEIRWYLMCYPKSGNTVYLLVCVTSVIHFLFLNYIYIYEKSKSPQVNLLITILKNYFKRWKSLWMIVWKSLLLVYTLCI